MRLSTSMMFWSGWRAVGMRALPPGFLEYHQRGGGYFGMRGEIITTDEFSSPKRCAQAILRLIRADKTE